MHISEQLRSRANLRKIESIQDSSDSLLDIKAANEIERLVRVLFFYAADCHGECCPERHRDNAGCGHAARLALIEGSKYV